MADEKKQEVKKKVEAKEKVLTIASVFQTLGQKGAKNRKDLAEKIIGYLKARGITVNIKNKEITEPRVTQQVSAMLRDIQTPRKGWWSTFSVVETATELKLVAKVPKQ